MLQEISIQPIADTTDGLFRVDPLKPEKVRAALCAFNDSVAATSSQVGAGRYVAFMTAGFMRNRPYAKTDLTAAPSIAGDGVRLDALCKALVLAGEKLDKVEEGAPAYHNRSHGLLVMATRLMRMRVAETYRRGVSSTREMVEDARDLVAAIGHDLLVDGTSNKATGTYEPGRLEVASFRALEPLLQEAGVASEDQAFIRNLLYGTDAALPGEIALYAYGRHFKTDCLTLSRDQVSAKIEELPAEKREEVQKFLEALEGDQNLAFRTMILKGCDMVPSYGLDERLWRVQSRLYHEETTTREVDAFPVIDEVTGEPILKNQQIVMFKFVGAEIDNRAGKAPEEALTARFVDPVLQNLFGEILTHIQNVCAKGVGPEVARGQAKVVLGEYAPHLTM